MSSRGWWLRIQDILDAEIAWRDVISTRNVAAHECFQLELEILWDTIQEDLPVLATQLQNLLDRELGDRR